MDSTQQTLIKNKMEVENDLEDDESMIFIKAREFLQLVGASAKTQNRQEYGDEFKASNDMNVKCNSEKHLNSEGGKMNMFILKLSHL